MNKHFFSFFAFLLFATAHISCKMNSGLFSKKTAREKYESKLENDSGNNNPAVNAWLDAGEFSLNHPLTVPPSYIESGKFSSLNNSATSLQVFVKRGQTLSVRLAEKYTGNVTVFLDLWRAPEVNNGRPTFILAADTSISQLDYAASQDERLIVRYQPKLNTDGTYHLVLHVDASFVFPISSTIKSSIGSFWGAGRDNNARKHEGIDIFAPKRSPVVAVANGVISSVSQNNLGGKVIFLRTEHTAYHVYYAHLDDQLVSEGQQVKAGDIIGLTGNTGNAKHTASHLHFGIYTGSGAIDPLAFVQRKNVSNKKVTDISSNTLMLTKKQTTIFTDLSLPLRAADTIPRNISVQAEAFNGSFYRIVLPDGRKAFAEAKDLREYKPAKG